jgi:hypothetical protein
MLLIFQPQPGVRKDTNIRIPIGGDVRPMVSHVHVRSYYHTVFIFILQIFTPEGHNFRLGHLLARMLNTDFQHCHLVTMVIL